MSDTVVCNTLNSLGSVTYQSSVKRICWKTLLNGVLRFRRYLFHFVGLQEKHSCKGLLFKPLLVSSLIHATISRKWFFVGFLSCYVQSNNERGTWEFFDVRGNTCIVEGFALSSISVWLRRVSCGRKIEWFKFTDSFFLSQSIYWSVKFIPACISFSHVKCLHSTFSRQRSILKYYFINNTSFPEHCQNGIWLSNLKNTSMCLQWILVNSE